LKRAALALALAILPAAARAAEPTPTPTPFPQQDGGPPPDATPSPTPIQEFDDAIHAPGTETPSPTPTPALLPPDHDAFLENGDSKWTPDRVFPGNYHALPLSAEVAWRPCLGGGCGADSNLYRRDGDVSIWSGFAFQPFAATSAPFMAVGADWVVGHRDGTSLRHASRFAPTWRWGWSFTAISVYGSAGVILPSDGRTHAGYHVGVGTSSIALLAVAACAGEALPSVMELGWDYLPDPATPTAHNRAHFVLKLGWGF
jgi:hypothetical protein